MSAIKNIARTLRDFNAKLDAEIIKIDPFLVESNQDELPKAAAKAAPKSALLQAAAKTQPSADKQFNAEKPKQRPMNTRRRQPSDTSLQRSKRGQHPKTDTTRTENRATAKTDSPLRQLQQTVVDKTPATEAEHKNPFADINPNDSRLGKLSADARQMMKRDTDKVSWATIAAKDLTYADALSCMNEWETNTPPSPFQLRTLVAGMVSARVEEQYFNDVFDKIAKRWRSVTKKILKAHREVAEQYRLGKERKDNDPAAATASFCVVNQAGFQDQVEAGREGLETANQKEPTLFRYGTELGEINHVPETGETIIQIVNNDSFRRHLSKAVSWAVANHDDSIRGVAAPSDVTDNLFSTPTLPLPFLERVTVAPSFDNVGNLLDQPGYQPSAYTFYAPPSGFEMADVSPTPSDDEMVEAVNFLVSEWLGDFAFDGYTRREIEVSMGIAKAEAGEAVKAPPPSLLNFLGWVLQTPCRALIGRSPMPALLVTKPVAGSGATKLIETAQILLFGNTSTRPAFPKDEDERRKAIFSALRASTPVLAFDNVKGSVDSPVLAALLTSTTFTDRVLGRSQERSVPNTASVAITGNNPRFTEELVRRLNLCRLDSGVPNPEKRAPEEFRHADLEGWVAANRGRLMWALCTLVQNWISKGQPRGSASVQSFIPWSNVIGGVIEAAGWAGFQNNREQLKVYASSDDDDPIQSLIQAWYDDTQLPKPVLSDPAYAGSLAVFCDNHDLELGKVKKRTVDGERVFDPTSLGRFLSSEVNRVFEVSDPDCGLVNVALVSGDKDKHGKPWRLERRKR